MNRFHIFTSLSFSKPLCLKKLHQQIRLTKAVTKIQKQRGMKCLDVAQGEDEEKDADSKQQKAF
jgi:hypothetical protein